MAEKDLAVLQKPRKFPYESLNIKKERQANAEIHWEKTYHADPGYSGNLISDLLGMSLTGGDPALMLAGDNAKPEQIEQIREDLGLNDPFIVRYGNYMKGMLTGDMGKS